MRLRQRLLQPRRIARAGGWLVLAMCSMGMAFPSTVTGEGPWRRWLQERFTQDQGLPQASPTAIAEDPQGYLWMTTFGGLVRFDGVSFLTLTGRELPGLVSDRLVGLVVDGSNLWVLSEYGDVQTLRRRGYRWQAEEPLKLGAGALAPRRGGGVWWVARGQGGVVTEDQRVEVRWQVAEEYRLAESVAELAPDLVAVGGPGGVWLYQGGALHPHPDPALQGGVLVSQIVPTGEGAGLAATSKGLFRFDASQAALVAGDVWVDRVLPDESGGYWLGLNRNGLWYLAQGRWHPALPEFGLAGSRILAIVQDRHGNRWVGADGRGLHRFSLTKAYSLFSEQEGLRGAEVRSVEAGAAEELWVALGCRGLLRLRGEQLVAHYPTEGCVQALFWTGEELLVGTYESGLCRWRAGQLEKLPSPASWFRHINSFCRTLNGQILVGGKPGLALYQQGKLLPLVDWQDIPVVSLTCHGATVLVGTLTGLVHLQGPPGSWRRVEELQIGAPVRWVHVAADGSWLVATYGSGLMRYVHGTLQKLDPDQGVEDVALSWVSEAPAGRVWVTGNRGVWAVSTQDLLQAFEDRGARLFPLIIGARQGLPATETNGGNHRPALVDRQGRLWVPTIAGLGLIPFQAFAEQGQGPRVVFERMREASGEVPLARQVVLGRSSRNVEVRFTALGAQDQDQAFFRWRFAGEGRWQHIGKRRALFFERFPPGQKALELQARTPTTSWGPVASLAVYRQPRFAETPWFVLTLVLAGVLAGVLVQVARGMQLRRRAVWLETQVQARTRERDSLEMLLETVNQGWTQQDILERTFDGLHPLVPFDHLSYWMVREGHLHLAWQRDLPPDARRHELPPVASQQEMDDLLAQEHRVLLPPKVEGAGKQGAIRRWLEVEGLSSVLVLPLRAFDRAVGYLLFACSARPFTPDHRRTLRLVAGQLSVMVEKARLVEDLEAAKREVEKLAVTDALTGLANRRAFDDWLGREWSRAQRTGKPITLVLADVDHFKAFNDALGHAAGDSCLRAIAQVVRGFARRAEDLAARWGGEELALILPGMEQQGAKDLAERVRVEVEALAIPHPASPVSSVVTVSLGVASAVPKPGQHWQLLWSAVDQALYRAKNGGRNRVVAVAGLVGEEEGGDSRGAGGC
ncbi:MAG: diguanylate cyclase [Thermoanaerobaculum sp.]|nr:diguanylate cyclase [Thermoanaerobaculum sp.]